MVLRVWGDERILLSCYITIVKCSPYVIHSTHTAYNPPSCVAQAEPLSYCIPLLEFGCLPKQVASTSLRSLAVVSEEEDLSSDGKFCKMRQQKNVSLCCTLHTRLHSFTLESLLCQYQKGYIANILNFLGDMHSALPKNQYRHTIFHSGSLKQQKIKAKCEAKIILEGWFAFNISKDSEGCLKKQTISSMMII